MVFKAIIYAPLGLLNLISWKTVLFQKIHLITFFPNPSFPTFSILLSLSLSLSLLFISILPFFLFEFINFRWNWITKKIFFFSIVFYWRKCKKIYFVSFFFFPQKFIVKYCWNNFSTFCKKNGKNEISLHLNYFFLNFKNFHFYCFFLKISFYFFIEFSA